MQSVTSFHGFFRTVYDAIARIMGWRYSAIQETNCSDAILTQKPDAIYQVAYVVENLSEVMNNWLSHTILRPFFSI